MDFRTDSGALPRLRSAIWSKWGEALTKGSPLPDDMLSSLMLFIPKGEFQEDVEKVVRRVAALRPITLMNSSSKLVALVAGEPLAAIADRVVHPAQQGFIAGREMGDNILEVEGSLVAFSMALESLPAAILLDFAQAFPSLARRWIWMILDRLGIFDELKRVIKGLYKDLRTTVFHQGCYLATFEMAAGIKQGCPLSGSLFDLATDGLIRASLTITMHRSARICLFAGDVAFVVYHLGASLASLLALMGSWKLATGLALKISKCAVVMGKRAQELGHRDVLQSNLGAEEMRLVDAALYLGVFVGPGAPSDQWDGVLAKAASRISDIAVAPSLMSRVLAFNTHLTSMFTFKAKFADFDQTVHKAYKWAVQKIARAPWQGFPELLLTSLRTLRIPLERVCRRLRF